MARSIKAANNNRKRGNGRARGSLQDQIQQALANDKQLQKTGEVDPMEAVRGGYYDPMNQEDIEMARAGYETAWQRMLDNRDNDVKLLGPPGPPTDNDFGSPIMDTGPQPVVDMLGRVIESAKRKAQQEQKTLVKADIDLCAIPPENLPLLTALPPNLREGTHKVTIARDSDLVFPQLYLSVYLTGTPGEKAQLASMFVRTGSYNAVCPEDADLVVFSGGSDIDPRLYGEERHDLTDLPNVERDNEYLRLYLQCLEEGIPMFGICGGAQALHIFNGGKLYQDVDGHHGAHHAYDVREAKPLIRISSSHHQLCMDNQEGGMEILLTARKSSYRWHSREKRQATGKDPDIEAFFYRDTCAFGVQGHPEYAGYHAFAKWTMDRINELVVCNPDLDWTEKNVRRMKPELIDIREKLIEDSGDQSRASIIALQSEYEARQAKKGK